jgi:hypothetical protein
MIAVSVDGADDVDCIHRYVCFLCCGSASAPRLTAYPKSSLNKKSKKHLDSI